MLEYLNEIEAQFIMWLPTITAVLSFVAGAVGLVFKFKKNDKVHNADIKRLETKIDNLNDNLKAVTQENVFLKRKINQTLSKLDHIHREEGE